MFSPPEAQPTAGRPWRRRILVAALAFAGAAAVFAAVLHLPVVRARVLDAALAFANRRFDLDVTARSLDYNLLTLRFTVEAPRVAARRTADRPFFTADRLEVDLPWTMLGGRRSLQSLRIDAPRITIAGDDAHGFNLPELGKTSGGGPALDIERLVVRDLAISVDDRVHAIDVRIQRASIRLGAGPGGTLEGRVRMGAPGAITVDEWTTTLTRLDATATLRSGALQLSSLTVGTTDGEVSLRGEAGLSTGAPIDLAIGARLDTARIIRGLAGGLRVAGALEVSGRVTGTLGQPRGALTLRAPSFALGTMVPGELSADVVVGRGLLDLNDASIVAPWGRIRASGRLGGGAASRPSRIDATWSGVDVAGAVVAVGTELPLRLSSASGGSATLTWPGGMDGPFSLRAATTLLPRAGSGLPLGGTAQVARTGGRWTIAHDVTAPGGTRAIGRLGIGDARVAALSGESEVSSQDIHATLASLARAGLAVPQEVVDAVDGALRARVAFTGTTDAPLIDVSAAADHLAYAPLPPARVEALVTVAGDHVDVGRLEATFDMGTARASGVRIDLPSGRLQGAVSAKVIDVGPLASAFWPEVGRVTGAVTADGRLGGTLDRLQVDASLQGTNLLLAGQQVDRVDGQLSWIDPRLEWRDLHTVRGGGTVSTTGWIDTRRERFHVDAAGTGLPITECPPDSGACGDGLAVSATLDRLAFSAEGTFEEPSGTVEFDARDLRWQGENAGRLDLRASFSDGEGTIDARLVDRGIHARGTVGLPSPGPFDFTIEATDAPVPDLLRLAGHGDDAERLSGALSATVRIAGERDHLGQASFDATLPPLSLGLDGQRWGTTETARVTYGPSHVAATNLALAIGESKLAISGGLTLDGDDSLSVALDGRLEDLVAIIRPTDIEAAGAVTARLVATGTPTAPLIGGSVTVDAGTITRDDVSVAIDCLAATLADGIVSVRGATLGSSGARATVDADLPVTLLAEQVPQRVMDALGSPPAGARATLGADLAVTLTDTDALSGSTLPLEGHLAMRLDLSADRLSIDAIQGTGIVRTADVAVGTSSLAQTGSGHLTIANGRVVLEPWTISGAGSDLHAEGFIDLGQEARPIALALSGPLVLEPLQALSGFPISGRLETAVRLSGTLAEPVAEGTVTLTGGAMRVRQPRLAVGEVHGTARFEGTVARLDDVSGLVNGAPFTLSGVAALPGTAATSARVLRLQAERVPVQPFAKGPRAEADLDLTYTDDGRARRVSGEVDLLPQPFRGSILALKQFLDSLGAGKAALGEPPRRRTPGATPIEFDIAVNSREPLLVDTNVGRVELDATLTVAGTLDQTALLGQVRILDDGVIRAGGRKYTIESGTIEFKNPRRVVPVINLTATTRISTYDVTMIMAGTPDSLQTSLTSDPPLAETDLRSLIVTGRLPSDPARERGESASEQQVVQAISGDLFGFAAQAIGLDAVSIGNPDFDLMSSNIDPSTSLNLTKALSKQLELVYSRDLQEDRSSYLLIYRPTRALSFRLLSRDNREGSVEFRHEIRFGGPKTVSNASASRRKRQKVTAVRFTGDLGFPESELAKLLRVRDGSHFDPWKWRGETERLARFYRERGFYAARIVARRQSEGDGVALEYAIHVGPRTTLAVDGHAMPDDVMEEMRNAWGESVSPGFLVEDLERIARTHLIDDGYLKPQVEVELPVQNDDAVAVLLHVRTGPLVKRRDIDLEGVSDAMRPELREFLEASRLRRTAWYDPSSLRLPVEAFYREQGYLEASAKPGAVQITGDRARLVLAVTEGREYRVKGVTVEGADVLGDDKVRSATGVAVDAPWRAAYLADALAAVQQAYHNAGFPDTEVYVEPQVDAAAGAVTLYVAVAEGQRQVLEDLAIEGTKTTMTKTVSDLVRLNFGDPVTPAMVSAVQKRLYDAGVFSRVSVDFTTVAEGTHTTSPHDDPVIAHVRVVEAPRFSVQYGIGVSRTIESTGTKAEYQPGAAVEFRDRNFLGRALGLGLGARADRRLQSERASLTMPRTWGSSVRSYLFLDRSHEITIPETGFEIASDTSTVSLQQRWRSSPSIEWSWGVAYDFENARLAAATPSGELAEVIRLKGQAVGPRVAMVWDTRDDPFDSHRGYYHSSGVDFGVPFMGSDQGFTRYLTQNFLFVPAGPIVLASAFRYGGLNTFGPENIIQINQYFNAGGSRSVRGYPEDSLSSIGFLGVPIGGKYMLVLNQEVRVPIWWWFKGAAFVDAGNTFERFSRVRLGNLKVGAGWGLRLATPLALIRFDAGYPVNDPERTKPRYYFSIGQAF